AWRPSWAPWGFADALQETPRTWLRFGASASRAFVLSPRAQARVEGTAVGGHGLDRFSRYGFDALESRLTGYPTATVRYDRGAILRTTVAWQAWRAARVSGFADVSRVRDRSAGTADRT